MIRSRVTLAMIEAAAMDIDSAVAANQRLGRNIELGQPVAVNQHRGRRAAELFHCRAHRRVCGVVDVEAVDGFDVHNANPGMSNRQNLRKQRLPASALSSFESWMPAGGLFTKITAAATTGPAHRPRPASSTPAMGPPYLRSSARSGRRVGFADLEAGGMACF